MELPELLMEADLAQVFSSLGALLIIVSGACLLVRSKRLFAQFIFLAVISIGITKIDPAA